MPAKIYSAQTIGLSADIIEVEADIAKGLHSFSIVGLPDKAVEEAKDRINAAIKNSGFKSPVRGNRKIIISLAPANIKKEGSLFDLAIALGYLKAAGELVFNESGKIFLGELALNGDIRPIRGALILAKKAEADGFTEIFVPEKNAAEAALLSNLKIYPCRFLKEVINHLSSQSALSRRRLSAEDNKNQVKSVMIKPAPSTAIMSAAGEINLDFSDIKGQETAKRGLEIAAAGGHNVAMFGPPGTGKTMLAKAFAGILPPLDSDEVIEVTGIHSAAGTLSSNLVTEPPFRSPHHTASYVSVAGGGTWPKPGEITLAHKGVLFLDEFPEFEKRVIEALRQPLEDRVISIARSKSSAIFPAHFILVAAMNPCPCGHRLTPGKTCVCTPSQLLRYERKLSGPIIDRIDLWLSVANVKTSDLSSQSRSNRSSPAIRQRIIQARSLQATRFKHLPIKTNSEMSGREIEGLAPLDSVSRKILNDAVDRLGLSARVYHRLIKLARTIADLAGREAIIETDILEALQYRPKQEF